MLANTNPKMLKNLTHTSAFSLSAFGGEAEEALSSPMQPHQVPSRFFDWSKTARVRLDTATSRRLDLPLLLWRRGVGRGGRHAGKPLLPLSAIAFVPLSPTLSPTLSPRSAGGEREKPPVAVSRYAQTALPAIFHPLSSLLARLLPARWHCNSRNCSPAASKSQAAQERGTSGPPGDPPGTG